MFQCDLPPTVELRGGGMVEGTIPEGGQSHQNFVLVGSKTIVFMMILRSFYEFQNGIQNSWYAGLTREFSFQKKSAKCFLMLHFVSNPMNITFLLFS